MIPLVYEDFDKAIEYLPVSYGSEAEHFTKGAAYAMKARFALYMSDWEIAAKAAKDCMDLGIYSLEADFSKLFLQSTKSNPEKIFVIPRSIANEVVLTPWIVKNELPRNAGGYVLIIRHGICWRLFFVLTGFPLMNHLCSILVILLKTETRVVPKLL